MNIGTILKDARREKESGKVRNEMLEYVENGL
jgi:hypothetical protein